MALAEKILGTKGKARLDLDLERYFGVEGSIDRNELVTMAKAPNWDGSPYKMKDLFPETYKTMTTIPADIDFSSLECVDGMFEGCEALVNADGLDISSALSADRLFYGCTSLVSANDIVWKKGISRNECFMDCAALTAPPIIDFSYAPNVRNIFDGCTSLPAKFPYRIDLSQYNSHYGYRAMFAGSSVVELDVTPRPVSIPFDTMFVDNNTAYRLGISKTSETAKEYLRDAFIHYLNGGAFPDGYNIGYTYEIVDEETHRKTGMRTVNIPAKDAFDALIVTMEYRYEYFLKTWLWYLRDARNHDASIFSKILNFVFDDTQEGTSNE